MKKIALFILVFLGCFYGSVNLLSFVIPMRFFYILGNWLNQDGVDNTLDLMFYVNVVLSVFISAALAFLACNLWVRKD
jgi:uncharacterized protein YqgC (DUF456 family)